MTTQYACANPKRRELVRAATDAGGNPLLNGIDYLEVSPSDQKTLLVRFLHPLPGQPGGVPAGPGPGLALAAGNFKIDGGSRVTEVRVVAVAGTAGDLITVQTNVAGDFSTYTLRLVTSPVIDSVPAGFDPQLAEVQFSFKIDCENEFDCAVEDDCPQPVEPAPHLNYLAKDYAGLRRLILDRLAELMPDWRERNPADLGIVLVELLAYVGDYLSYYQDAVATEAYLGTARRRSSVRRHARLVDYTVHEGANARAWLVFDTTADRGNPASPAVPKSTRVLTAANPAQSDDGAVVFETLHELVTLRASRNGIAFYTWGDTRCCLPAGATRATLEGSQALLDLKRGDVLIFEEVLGALSGLPEDADRSHRHAVRLADDPVERTDPLTQSVVVDVRWHDADALPFPLCLNAFDDGAGGLKQAAVARGNVALADHGLSYESGAAGADLVPAQVSGDAGRPYRPQLVRAGLTHAAEYVDAMARNLPASAAMHPGTDIGIGTGTGTGAGIGSGSGTGASTGIGSGTGAGTGTGADVGVVLPAIVLRGEGETWRARRDLLGSDRFAPEFVVEMEDDGRAMLRFGDGTLGRNPAGGTAFKASYRIGGGAAGNVGAEALTRLVPPVDGLKVRNPLPARGGLEPEPIGQVKLFAPQAFRTQERAVTEADYAAAVQRHPEVQRAAATRRWTGSWYTMFVTVDRRGGRPVDRAFAEEIRDFLEPFRMAGYDLEIDAPRFVPLDIALTICVKAHHYKSGVKQALLEAFGRRQAAGGTGGAVGFFHPDNFSFGQPVYLSQIVARAMQVPGVEVVLSTDVFQRFGQDAHGEIEQGFLPIHRLEIARLDNDPSAQENGRMAFVMKGGV